MKLFDVAIEGFWRALTVVVILWVIAVNSQEQTWVFKYLIPITGLYYVLMPTIKLIRDNKK